MCASVRVCVSVVSRTWRALLLRWAWRDEAATASVLGQEANKAQLGGVVRRLYRFNQSESWFCFFFKPLRATCTLKQNKSTTKLNYQNFLLVKIPRRGIVRVAPKSIRPKGRVSLLGSEAAGCSVGSIAAESNERRTGFALGNLVVFFFWKIIFHNFVLGQFP